MSKTIWGNPVTFNDKVNEIVVGNTPIIPRATWNNLSTEAKQSYGYVGVTDTDLGYTRGKLYYGRDFLPIGKYIPYSEPDKIICEATLDNFDGDIPKWGDGDRPITFINATPQVDSSTDSVFIRTASNGEIGYVDLGAVDTTFTAYLVAKTAVQGSFTRIICATASHGANMAPMLYSNGWDITLSKWTDGVTLGAKSNTWFVAALKCTGAGSPYKGAAFDGSNIIEIKSTGNPTSVGRYLTLARTDIGSESNQLPNDMYVKYLGVTTTADTDETIIKNIKNLYSCFVQA